MQRRIILGFLFVSGVFCVTILFEQFDGFTIKGRTQTNKEKTPIINKREKIKNIDEPNPVLKTHESEITTVIKNYIGFAKQGNLADLRKLVIKVPTSDYFSFNENIEKPVKDRSNSSPKENVEEPKMSGFPRVYYDFVTRQIPQTIYIGQRDFRKVSKFWVKDKNVKVLVELENAFSQTLIIKQNYYLTKDKAGKWKIFLVEQNSSDRAERNEDFL